MVRGCAQVEECEPRISPVRLEALLREVNSTNRFSDFVKQMRREFKTQVVSN
jgi:hypothetical protein